MHPVVLFFNVIIFSARLVGAGSHSVWSIDGFSGGIVVVGRQLACLLRGDAWKAWGNGCICVMVGGDDVREQLTWSHNHQCSYVSDHQSMFKLECLNDPWVIPSSICLKESPFLKTFSGLLSVLVQLSLLRTLVCTQILANAKSSILAYHKRTGKVLIPKYGKLSLCQKLQEEDLQVCILLFIFTAHFISPMFYSISTNLCVAHWMCIWMNYD